MSRDRALAAAAAHFDDGSFARVGAARGDPQREPGPGTGRRAARLSGRRTEQHAGRTGLRLPGVRQPAARYRLRPLPDRRASRGCGAARGADVRPWRRGARPGASWTRGRGPWTLAVGGDRLYGRGTADNKGQHSINLAALAATLAARGGRLGFNATWLFETGEETGSPGLAEFCAQQRERLAAGALIASDGPRLRAEAPTLFLGTRGVANFELHLKLRDGAHHSGNWGRLLRNPGTVLAAAIASLVDGQGVIRVPGLRPPPIPANVRAALAGLEPGGGPDDPAVDADWGEPGLRPIERVLGWNALEVLAMRTGNPDYFPVNAIPAHAQATLQLRFVVGTDVARLRELVHTHLQARGDGAVEVSEPVVMQATRLDPDNACVRVALQSIETTTGSKPVLLPNLGGSLPNDVFADGLGLPTVWIPHGCPGCSQHAPDEHLLAPVARQALQLMTGLFWDLGEQAAALPRRRAARA